MLFQNSKKEFLLKWWDVIVVFIAMLLIPLMVHATFTDDDAADFNSGTHNATQFSGGSLNMNATDNIWEYPDNAVSTDWIDMTDNVGLYHMDDDPSNGADDDSGNSNDGSCTNCPDTAGSSRHDGAYDFNGSNDFLDLGSGTDMDTDGEMSFFTWVNPGNVTTNKLVAGQCSAGGVVGQWAIGIGYTNNEFTFYWGGTGPFVETNMDMIVGDWYHLGVVRSGSTGNWTATIYVNGQAVDTASAIATNPGSQTGTSLGRCGEFNGAFFDGVLDESVLFKDRAITAAEAAEIYDRQFAERSGYFDSQIFDATASASWDTLAWVPTHPQYKELVGSEAIETAYATNNIDMTSNTLLLHLDESSGTIEDVSGNDNDGTNNGATYGAVGMFDDALSFDGANDYVDFGTPSTLDMDGEMSFSGWIRFGNTGDNTQYIIGQCDNGGSIGQFSLDVARNTNRVVTVGWGNTTIDETTATTVIPEEWIHVGFTRSGSTGNWTSRLYINGELDETRTSIATNPADTPDTTSLGRCGDSNGSYFGGFIDEVALFQDRVLTDAEMQDMYERGRHRLNYQVRSCDDSGCSGETFIGPDGTDDTFYSELTNTAIGLPSVTLSNVSDNQYFQYRAFLDSDDSGNGPEISSVTTEETVAGVTPVPEFTTIMYMLIFIGGMGYIYLRISENKKQFGSV